MAASTSGLSQLRSGCWGMNECSQYWPVASSSVHAAPQARKADSQSLGGPPSGAGSRQTYQSRFGSSRLRRDASNHGWRSEVWLGTQSITMRMPRVWHSATRRSKSARLPNRGSTSQ